VSAGCVGRCVTVGVSAAVALRQGLTNIGALPARGVGVLVLKHYAASILLIMVAVCARLCTLWMTVGGMRHKVGAMYKEGMMDPKPKAFALTGKGLEALRKEPKHVNPNKEAL